MDRSLIRNNKDLPENIRDPEQAIGRLQHFWDAHDLGKQFVDPRGPFENKSLYLYEDAHGSLSPYIGGSMPYEGAVPYSVLLAARSALAKSGGDRSELWTPSRLVNSMVTVESPDSLLTGDRVARIGDDSTHDGWRHINPTGSSEPIWEAHRNAVKSRRNTFANLDFDNPDENDLLSYQDTIKGIHDALAAHPPTEEEQGRYKRHDPRYVRVAVLRHGQNPSSTDILDLHTGNWARILQGNQFDHE